MKETIALIDDDRNILTSLSIALEKEGFKVQTYVDGESALIGLARTPPDLAVIDIKMPKMDGEELLKKLRKKTSLPVIFLTSKDDEIDELLGLKLGADDFIKKSGGFSIKVLIERIRVQLRKKNASNIEETKNIINHGKLRLDPSQLECEWDGKQLPDKLTTTEFLIVQELAKRPGIIKERSQLMDIAYREDTDIEDRTIDSHVKRIRVQLRKKNPSNIEETKNVINHGKLRLDPSQLECEWDGKQLPDKLTTTEFLIVQELAKRPGIIKERSQLMDIAYREDTDIEDRTIDSHVKRIRKKFKKVDNNFSAIETRYGSGYRWNVS